MKARAYHVPVLASAVARLAAGRRRVVDATVGGGGHGALFREQDAEVLAVDRDPDALRAARGRLGDRGMRYLEGSFADPEILSAIGGFRPEFVLLDLGVSSHQLDDDARGFSFRPGVALDMRMSGRGVTAAEVLNTWSADELARLFRAYGDERRATRLARVIADRRQHAPLRTSDDLVKAIRRALGPRSGAPEFARLFQAVRIAVNRELDALERALPALRDALGPRGILAVISYHSGEDRVVKDALREWARACVCPPHQPVCTCRGRPLGRLVLRRPVTAGPAEVAENPRARSARLRAFEVDDGR